MGRRKRYIRKPSKYEDEATIVESTVTKIDFQNKEINGKLKTVFYCKSYLCPDGDGRMCITWQRNTIQIGDKVAMKGRFIGNESENPEERNVFIAWSVMILNHKKDDTQDFYNSKRI